MNNINICVLMSTYNGEKYLEQQINSILNQKNVNVKLFVRDDGSTDNTIQILKKYQDDNKLLYYKGENLKPAKSFLDLMLKAPKSDYYAFADQDDVWFDDKLYSTYNMIKQYNIPCMAYSNVTITDSNLNKIKNLYKNEPHNNFETIVCCSNIIGCTIVFNNKLEEIIKKYGKPEILNMHDAYLSKVCLSIGGKIEYNKESTMLYRQHENNVVGVKTNNIINFICKIITVFEKADVPIDLQAKEIYYRYSNIISQKEQEWLIEVMNYKKSLINRIKLAFSQREKYINKNMSLKIRLMILLGNR